MKIAVHRYADSNGGRFNYRLVSRARLLRVVWGAIAASDAGEMLSGRLC